MQHMINSSVFTYLFDRQNCLYVLHYTNYACVTHKIGADRTLLFVCKISANWTFMYFLIYPCYTLIVIVMKSVLKDRVLWYSVLCGVLSFMTGQLLQVPYLLFSSKVTAFYLLAGLKTSLIQGVLSAVSCFVLFQPLRVVLKKIERRLNV